MSYVNHFEIEARRPDSGWEHVGNVYPKYQWAIRRPWYFLGLVRRPVIVNDAGHQAHVTLAHVAGRLERMQTCEPLESVWVWAWRRGWFNRLSKTLVLELP